MRHQNGKDQKEKILEQEEEEEKKLEKAEEKRQKKEEKRRNLEKVQNQKRTEVKILKLENPAKTIIENGGKRITGRRTRRAPLFPFA